MENTLTDKIQLSVIIPVTERYDPVDTLFQEYKKGVEATGLSHEFIYVLDGAHPEALEALSHIGEHERITIVTLAKWFGEATALNVGLSEASGDAHTHTSSISTG